MKAGTVATPNYEQEVLRLAQARTLLRARDLTQHGLLDGVHVPVFNAARTVVDCFRFRNKIGLDVALEALRDGWHQRKFVLDDLWRHAALGRVANLMRPYIEAVTT